MQETAFQTWVKTKCIGITGGVATGKSTVASIIKDMDFVVFDADKLSRTIMVPGMPAFIDILQAFGDEILSPSGTIDRKKLGDLIFDQKDARLKLEAITHKRIKEEFFVQATAQKQAIGISYFFYEAALIFEVGREKEFFKTICTWCSEDEQIRRLVARNGITTQEAKAIIASQMPSDQKRDRASIPIDTNCTIADLKIRVSKALDF